jgi:hypothetical protein
MQFEDSNTKSMDILKAKVAFPSILVLQIFQNFDTFCIRLLNNANLTPTIIYIMAIFSCLVSSYMIFRAVKNDITQIKYPLLTQ